MKKRLAIIGSGDLGQLISYHASIDGDFEVVGFFDDYAKEGSIVGANVILGNLNNVTESFGRNIFDMLMIGIGYNHMEFRKKTFELYSGKIPFANIVHSSAFIDPSVKFGEGVFILPGCVLDKDVEIGNNVLLNTGVVIAHDTKIESHCFLSPAVAVAGKTLVKTSCVVGINSTIIDNIIVESDIRIAGGAVVTKNLTIAGLYAGVPAVFKKK